MTLLSSIKRKFSLAVAGAFCFTCNLAAAAEPPAMDDPGVAAAGFGRFVARINTLTNAAIDTADFQYWVHLIFLFFAILTTIWIFIKYVFKATSMYEVVTVTVQALFVYSLMQTFAVWTAASWGVAEGVAGSLQFGMIGTKDTFFAPQFITNVMSNMTFKTATWKLPIAVIVTAINMSILSVAMLLLSVLSYVTVMWGFWGYQLAKLMGLMCVPFLMYERLAWLFDGWLRMYFGALIYYIIARLNIVMVACSLAIFLGVPIPFTLTVGTPIELPAMASIFDAIGVTTFVAVGLLSLFSTGKFAATIVAGAGGGGIGGAVMGAARAVAALV